MKCEFCHQNDATIHLTQVVDGNMKKINLCQKCAQSNGLDLNSPISITDMLLGLGAIQNETETINAPFDLSCSKCCLTRAEFKKRSRLGCPECYRAFMGELNAVIKAMHQSDQHVGKIPARQGCELRVVAQVAALQKEIEGAIAKEDYEDAARLRDKILDLKGSVLLEEQESSNDVE